MTKGVLRLMVLASLIAASLMGYWLGQQKSQGGLAVIDIKRAISTPARMLAKSRLSQDEQKRLLERYSASLQSVIRKYGKQHRLTIVSSTVLFHDSNNDITALIISKTLDEVRHA